MQRALVAQLDLGWTDRFATRLVVQGRSIDASGRLNVEDEGLGDSELWGRVSLGAPLARWSGVASAGIALPTGDDPDPALADESAFFGAGASSLLLAGEAGRPLGTSGSLFFHAGYRRPLGAASSGYRVGDDASWTAAYSVTPGAGRTGVVVGLSGRHLGQDEESGAPVATRGGRLHHLQAGLTLGLGGAGRIALVARRLVEQQVRGDQLLSEWSFAASYSMRFKTRGAD